MTFIACVTWHGMVFARDQDGATWRIWHSGFDPGPSPLLEKLSGLDMGTYRAAMADLDQLCSRGAYGVAG